jgi:DNA-binding transcriptional ArsR family regulator
MSKIDLILHPVRLRVLIAIGQRERTVSQIAASLPDVAQATLYRHIKALADGGVLTVTDETPIRGTVERTYALADAKAAFLTADDVADLSKEDHLRYFAVFTASLLASFSAYVESRENLDMVVDGVGYHTHEMYMNQDDLVAFGQGLAELMAPYSHPSAGRDRKLFSTIIMPGGHDK